MLFNKMFIKDKDNKMYLRIISLSLFRRLSKEVVLVYYREYG